MALTTAVTELYAFAQWIERGMESIPYAQSSHEVRRRWDTAFSNVRGLANYYELILDQADAIATKEKRQTTIN